MSTVARSMKNELQNRAKISAEIINLIDFYVPIRGNMRRNRSRSSSLIPNDENSEIEVLKEIKTIDTEVDFDDPAAVDYDLLIKGLRHLIVERQPFNRPVYDKFFKVRTEKTVIVQPMPVIIIEGALLFCNPDL